jgi:tartrate-resistant acid phosphatase type 5
MNKYNPFSLLIPFLLCTTALPIDVAPKYEYTPRDIRILSVGDWGSAALGGYHLRNAENTADAMKIYASEYKPKLVLNTGDNFYYCGIHNTSDPQISADYVELFGNIGLPWYNTLGNHDYGFNPDAQLALNETIPTWNMDARYYHKRIVLDGVSNESVVLNIIVLDTNPCIADYRGDDRAKWDPCSIQYPTCAPMEGECMFHQNIIQQDCKTQLDWFNATLSNINPAGNEWVFVLGHHKADEIDVEDFQDILNSNRVHLYLNGHNHNLEHYSIDGQAKYMTTGAGGMVIIGGGGVKLHKTASNFAKGHGHNHNHNHNHHHQDHQVKSVWSKIVTGFTSHTFMEKSTKVKTEYWDTNQNMLYNFTISIS